MDGLFGVDLANDDLLGHEVGHEGVDGDDGHILTIDLTEDAGDEGQEERFALQPAGLSYSSDIKLYFSIGDNLFLRLRLDLQTSLHASTSESSNLDGDDLFLEGLLERTGFFLSLNLFSL